MEPAFQRGDLLFLTNYKEDPIRVGEIVVFKVKGRDIPIVHRVIKLHERLVPLKASVKESTYIWASCKPRKSLIFILANG